MTRFVDYTRRPVAGPVRFAGGWLQPCAACGRTGRTATYVDRLVEHVVEQAAPNMVIVRDGCTVPLPPYARGGCAASVPAGDGVLIAGLDGLYCSGSCGERAWREKATLQGTVR